MRIRGPTDSKEAPNRTSMNAANDLRSKDALDRPPLVSQVATASRGMSPELQRQAFSKLFDRSAPVRTGYAFSKSPVASSLPIQTFSKLGSSDDRFEREAHAIADKLDGCGGAVGGTLSRVGAGQAGLQNVHPSIQASIQAARGGGSPLSGSIGSSTGARLGADLSHVRVHTDARANQLATQLNARAFTTGSDVFFRQGEYRPETSEGSSVLNHELAHVVQQCGPGPNQSRGQPSQAPIQRLIMRIETDNDDDYIESMMKTLVRRHGNERIMSLKDRWALNDEGVPIEPIYAPKKTVKTWKFENWQRKTEQRPKRLLKRIRATEPLRIVSHGSPRRLIGGYSPADMATMLAGLGLPEDWRGGIEIYGCLPGMAIPHKDTKLPQTPYILELKGLLGTHGITTEVSGYEHIIHPDDRKDPYEVALSAHLLWDDVVMPLSNNYHLTHLEDTQMAQIREMMGDAGKALLAKYCDATGKFKESYSRSWVIREIQEWMEKNHLYFKTATLRSTANMQDEKRDNA